MNKEAFCSGLLDGNFHRGGIRCLQLFHLLEPHFSNLVEDVQRYLVEHRPSNVADANHITHWVGHHGEVLQFSLFNPSGRADDYSHDHNLSCKGKWFYDSYHYLWLNELITDLPHLINFRINVLSPGAELSPHEEHVPFQTQQGSVGARVRFHLPIMTNPNAEIHLDGQVYHLKAGRVYIINHGCVHAAYNSGSEARIHLVWDALLTPALFNFLFGDDMLPAYLGRISSQVPDPVRCQPIGVYRSLRSTVSESLANTLDLCEPQ